MIKRETSLPSKHVHQWGKIQTIERGTEELLSGSICPGARGAPSEPFDKMRRHPREAVPYEVSHDPAAYRHGHLKRQPSGEVQFWHDKRDHGGMDDVDKQRRGRDYRQRPM
jgi:hypothetical protein